MKRTCGCGRKAEYLVYAHKEPHCRECLESAIDCEIQILVRKIDVWSDVNLVG